MAFTGDPKQAQIECLRERLERVERLLCNSIDYYRIEVEDRPYNDYARHALEALLTFWRQTFSIEMASIPFEKNLEQYDKEMSQLRIRIEE